ncbi:hypothetical protein BU16DRAFT_559723 [Lophium mytilinum]|uniref:Uncharacterized protein n=1 Tax=Lophium mytilinum TaxID=390894 RepID=A0A6A6R0F8_9PEZI|nr:hypothetical protein BU16DRAFT_559723 [Lophium mytilinum]
MSPQTRRYNLRSRLSPRALNHKPEAISTHKSLLKRKRQTETQRLHKKRPRSTEPEVGSLDSETARDPSKSPRLSKDDSDDDSAATHTLSKTVLTDLPEELLDLIVTHTVEKSGSALPFAGWGLLSATRQLSRLALPVLYQQIDHYYSHSSGPFRRTILQDSGLAHYVRKVVVQHPPSTSRKNPVKFTPQEQQEIRKHWEELDIEILRTYEERLAEDEGCYDQECDNGVELALLISRTLNLRHLDIRSTMPCHGVQTYPDTTHRWLPLLRGVAQGTLCGKAHHFSFLHHLSVNVNGIGIHKLSSIFCLPTLRTLEISGTQYQYQLPKVWLESALWECTYGTSPIKYLTITGNSIGQFTLSSTIRSCKALTSLRLDIGRVINPCVSRTSWFGVPSFTLAGHTSSLEMLHLNCKGGAHPKIEDYDSWLLPDLYSSDSLGSMTSLTSLIIPMEALLWPDGTPHPLKDLLPSSLQTLYISSSWLHHRDADYKSTLVRVAKSLCNDLPNLSIVGLCVYLFALPTISSHPFKNEADRNNLIKDIKMNTRLAAFAKRCAFDGIKVELWDSFQKRLAPHGYINPDLQGDAVYSPYLPLGPLAPPPLRWARWKKLDQWPSRALREDSLSPETPKGEGIYLEDTDMNGWP